MKQKITQDIIASEAKQSLTLRLLRPHCDAPRNDTKLLLALLVLAFSFIPWTFAEDSNVQIKKTEDRTGAVLSTVIAPPKASSGNPVDRFFSVIESGIMDVAEPTSYWVGRGIDAVTTGVQKAGALVLSRGFQAVDVKNKLKSEVQETN